MLGFIYSHFKHFMFGFLLISRLGDVLSTLFATPKLKFESNIIAKKLGKPYIFLTLLISLVAYYDIAISIVILIPSLLVSASNIGKIWFLRTFGEDNYHKLFLTLIKKNGVTGLILLNILSSFFIVLIAVIIFILYPRQEDWGFWIAYGFLLYGIIIIFWGTINSVILHFKTRKMEV